MTQANDVSRMESAGANTRRYALYFTPPPDHPLTMSAARWLGRDAFSGQTTDCPVAALDPHDWGRCVAFPRRYGFHGTLKAPFRLAYGASKTALLDDLEAFCAELPAFEIPPLAVGRLGSFFALLPSAPVPALHALAAALVQDFDTFRAPLTEAEIAKRNVDRLSDTERDYLDRWGYPYVFDAFRFHMTLTGPVAADAQDAVEAVLRSYFEPVLGAPLLVDAVTVFVEDEPDTPFMARHRLPLALTG